MSEWKEVGGIKARTELDNAIRYVLLIDNFPGFMFALIR